jgi:cation transport ATPase
MSDTLTSGHFSVAKVTRLGAASENACLLLAGTLQGGVAASRAFPGRGIEARLDGRRVRIGTEAFCRELCGFPPAGPAHPNFDGCFVFMAEDSGWLAAFELTDSLRPEAGAALVRALWIENCAPAF